MHNEHASLDSCTGLFLRALHAFRKSTIHLFLYTQISVTNYRIRNVLAANLMIHYTCVLRNSVNSILASSFSLGPRVIHHSFVYRLLPLSFFFTKIVSSISLLLLQYVVVVIITAAMLAVLSEMVPTKKKRSYDSSATSLSSLCD